MTYSIHHPLGRRQTGPLPNHSPTVPAWVPQQNLCGKCSAAGGSVLLNKERSVREILNDANGNLINLYRVVREHPDELKDRLLYVLHSREDFQIAQHRLRWTRTR